MQYSTTADGEKKGSLGYTMARRGRASGAKMLLAITAKVPVPLVLRSQTMSASHNVFGLVIWPRPCSPCARALRVIDWRAGRETQRGGAGQGARCTRNCQSGASTTTQCCSSACSSARFINISKGVMLMGTSSADCREAAHLFEWWICFVALPFVSEDFHSRYHAIHMRASSKGWPDVGFRGSPQETGGRGRERQAEQYFRLCPSMSINRAP